MVFVLNILNFNSLLCIRSAYKFKARRFSALAGYRRFILKSKQYALDINLRMSIVYFQIFKKLTDFHQ